MDLRAGLLADDAQPGQAGMGELADRAAAGELKDRSISKAGPFVRQPQPSWTAQTGGGMTVRSFADGVDVIMLPVGRPVALEVVEKGRPVRCQAVHLEIAQREREAVVDAHQGWDVLRELLDQPERNAVPAPVRARGGRRENLDRWRGAAGLEDAQGFQTALRRFRAGVVDADGAGEGRCGDHLRDAPARAPPHRSPPDGAATWFGSAPTPAAIRRPA